MRTAMMPPRTAQYWPAGCSITATVPGSAQSTQCVPAGKLWVSAVSGTGSFFAMNLAVHAGAMILGAVAFRPMVGEKGTGCARLVCRYGAGSGWRTKVCEMACSRGGALGGLLEFE